MDRTSFKEPPAGWRDSMLGKSAADVLSSFIDRHMNDQLDDLHAKLQAAADDEARCDQQIDALYEKTRKAREGKLAEIGTIDEECSSTLVVQDLVAELQAECSTLLAQVRAAAEKAAREKAEGEAMMERLAREISEGDARRAKADELNQSLQLQMATAEASGDKAEAKAAEELRAQSAAATAARLHATFAAGAPAALRAEADKISGAKTAEARARAQVARAADTRRQARALKAQVEADDAGLRALAEAIARVAAEGVEAAQSDEVALGAYDEQLATARQLAATLHGFAEARLHSAAVGGGEAGAARLEQTRAFASAQLDAANEEVAALEGARAAHCEAVAEAASARAAEAARLRAELHALGTARAERRRFGAKLSRQLKGDEAEAEAAAALLAGRESSLEMLEAAIEEAEARAAKLGAEAASAEAAQATKARALTALRAKNKVALESLRMRAEAEASVAAEQRRYVHLVRARRREIEIAISSSSAADGGATGGKATAAAAAAGTSGASAQAAAAAAAAARVLALHEATGAALSTKIGAMRATLEGGEARHAQAAGSLQQLELRAAGEAAALRERLAGAREEAWQLRCYEQCIDTLLKKDSASLPKALDRSERLLQTLEDPEAPDARASVPREGERPPRPEAVAPAPRPEAASGAPPAKPATPAAAKAPPAASKDRADSSEEMSEERPRRPSLVQSIASSVSNLFGGGKAPDAAAAEAKAKAEAEEKARARAEEIAREQADAKAQEEAAAKAKTEADAKAEAEAEAVAKAKAEEDAKGNAEEDAKAKAAAEVKAKAAAEEEKAMAEALAKAKAEAAAAPPQAPTLAPPVPKPAPAPAAAPAPAPAKAPAPAAAPAAAPSEFNFTKPTEAELAGKASQIDEWLDKIRMAMCKKEVREVGLYKLIDLANMDSTEFRKAFPKMEPKVRNKLLSKLEEVEIPDDSGS